MQISKASLQVFVLTALGYFLAGRLALLLAIPPGYATAISPSAGIALVVILLHGYRFWPAVALGSFAVNSYGALVWGEGIAAWAASAQLPFIIALGAAVQAVVSVYLLRRFIGYPITLDTSSDVLKFIVLVCGGGSMLNASVGTAALWQAGALAAGNIPYNWFTWWVGDGLGVMLVAPLIFVYRAQPRGIWRSRNRVLPWVQLLASVVIVLLYVFASRWELARQETAFERHAGQLYQRSDAVLNSYFESLYAAQAFFVSSSEVTPEDFRRFVQGALQRNPGFQGIAWNRVIAHSERGELERLMSQELGEPVVFTEVDRNGTRMRASRRESYVVIRYIQPLSNNRRAYGYDISSNPIARNALMKAATSGEPSATAPIRLIQERGQQLGEVVYFPVIKNGALEGYVAGVFRLGDLMSAALQGESLQGISLRLLSAESKPQLLFAADGRESDGKGEIFRRVWELGFADQTWRLEISGNQQFLVDSRSVMPWGVLATGLLFVGLLGMSLLVLTGAKYHSDESGRELAETVKQLRDAQGQLVEAEKLAALGGMVAGFAHELNTPIGIAITAQSTFKADLERLEAFTELVPDEADKQRRNAILLRMNEAATMVLDNLQRAGNLIGSFKQVSVDQSSEDRRKINLHDYLHDVLLHLSPSYRRAGHEVKFECPRDIYIETVPGGLTQVIVNLMNNALSHAFVAGQQGRITLSVERAEQAVVLRFSDDGQGMADAVRERIFEPFFTTRRGSNAASAGLGLHLVYSIVRQQLDGEIAVSSTPGEGSIFTISLPLSLEASAPPGKA
ncbi:CHASE domain-containing protein [Spongiibacter marinus]|uniref:CHASE domain-containing protein n=1 Tax=Spongiibacter marinus TaxID=354246 RepID=UPI00196098AB|nr:CHASE domain-containing protein [Spongiibacter marinus]MBM7424440.1 signal transduction histidine kinase/integral membrane sensor domain MASE1 [Spongiibacter marinus]